MKMFDDNDNEMYSIPDLQSDLEFFEKNLTALKLGLDYTIGELNYRLALLEFDANQSSDKPKAKLNNEEREKFASRQEAERIGLQKWMEGNHND
jgi:hypothetical protein